METWERSTPPQTAPPPKIMLTRQGCWAIAAVFVVVYVLTLSFIRPGQKHELLASSVLEQLTGLHDETLHEVCYPMQVEYNEINTFPSRLVFGVMVCNDETRDESRVSAAQQHIVAYARQLKQLNALFKSVALLTSEHVHFAMVCDSDATYQDVVQLVRDWPQHFCDKISFSYHKTWYPSQSLHLKYLNRPCSSSRHFFPYYFAHSDRIINLDSDMIMLAPMEHLWAHFDTFDNMNIIGASALMFWPDDRFKAFPKPKHVVPESNGTMFDDGINTGIMLMHLDRWRLVPQWTPFERYLLYVNDVVDKYGKWFVHPTQDIFNVWLGEFPDHYYELPCEWNIRTTQVWPSRGRKHKAEHFPNMCGWAEREGAKALHGAGGHFVDGTLGFHEVFEEFQNFSMKLDTLQDLKDRLNNIFYKDEDLKSKKGWFLAHLMKLHN